MEMRIDKWKYEMGNEHTSREMEMFNILGMFNLLGKYEQRNGNANRYTHPLAPTYSFNQPEFQLVSIHELLYHPSHRLIHFCKIF
jgi:hypothetical protein